MVGILCEKPSAAKNFAKALGGSKGRFADTDYQIVNALGHLYEFAQPNDMVDDSKANRYKSWDVKNLPWNFFTNHIEFISATENSRWFRYSRQPAGVVNSNRSL